MSIADKLTTIAENEQKVYEAGYNKGTEDGIAQGEANGYWQGYYGYHDEFWNAFQANGARTDYHMAFSGGGWTNEIFKPKYDLILSAYGGYNMFNDSRLTGSLKDLLDNAGVTLDTSNCQHFSTMFSGSRFTELPVIDMSKCAASGNLCLGMTQLHTIEKIIMSETTATSTSMFQDCLQLQNIVFEGVLAKSISFANCSILTNETVQSLIDILKDLTGGTAQTLTLHATVKNNLTEEQKAQITSKNWTLA